MLHFSYCRFMEPALKQCVDPLTLPVNPSAQSNGHLKQQHLLVTMWLLGCKVVFNAQNLFWENLGVRKRSVGSMNFAQLWYWFIA